MSRLLNLEETKHFLKGCIRSCETSEQLNICREIIDQFIVKRFKHYAKFMELSVVLNELDEAISDQKSKIVINVYSENSILETTN
jgi:hypothetical protein